MKNKNWHFLASFGASLSVKSSTELMLYVVLTMPTLNKAYYKIFFGIL
jgi:hypothetical protein